MAAGYVDPQNLLFARARITEVREVAEKACRDISALDEQYADVYRAHPFHEPPDIVAALQALISGREFRTVLDLS